MNRIVSVTLSLLCMLIIPHQVIADFDMSNGSYSIDQGSVDDTAPQPTTIFHASEVPPPVQVPPKSPASTGVLTSLTIGNSAVTDKNPLTVSLSQGMLDYGTLYPTDPILRNHTLTVSPGASRGYVIFSSEDHTLLSTANQFIPDTTCDDGTCSSTIASAWENTLTYGLGFSCSSTSGTCIGIPTQDVFKRVANKDKHEFPALLYQNLIPESSTETLTYKVNASATQPNASYTNTINYLIVPTY